MCVNLPVFFSQGYRPNEWTDWSVCGINRSGMICRLYLCHFRKNWLNNNEYISKKIKYFWSKKILCLTVFSYYVSRSSARDRITPSIPYTYSSRSYTGQRLRLADLRFPPLPASLLIVFVISVIDIHHEKIKNFN